MQKTNTKAGIQGIIFFCFQILCTSQSESFFFFPSTIRSCGSCPKSSPDAHHLRMIINLGLRSSVTGPCLLSTSTTPVPLGFWKVLSSPMCCPGPHRVAFCMSLRHRLNLINHQKQHAHPAPFRPPPSLPPLLQSPPSLPFTT